MPMVTNAQKIAVTTDAIWLFAERVIIFSFVSLPREAVEFIRFVSYLVTNTLKHKVCQF